MPDFDDLRRRYEAGDQGALHAAANSCRRPGAEWVALPAWVLDALVAHNIEYMRELAPGSGKGSTATWAQRARKDLVHLTRYSEVCRALKEGCSHADAYRHAAEALANTVWADGTVTPDAVRKSYELIRRQRERDPEGFRRRFTFSSPGWMLVKN
jgi:hypothetical protein